jgi:hypothetical protein
MAAGVEALLTSARLPLPARPPRVKAFAVMLLSKVSTPPELLSVSVLSCSAFWFARSSVPALTTVAPVNVFAPVSVRVPVPCLSRPPSMALSAV